MSNHKAMAKGVFKLNTWVPWFPYLEYSRHPLHGFFSGSSDARGHIGCTCSNIAPNNLKLVANLSIEQQINAKDVHCN